MSTIAEQHRATTEVLKLISSSSGDPQEVFANILASAVRICDADNGAINRWDGEALHLVATPQDAAGTSSNCVSSRLTGRSAHSPSARVLATGRPVHVADLAANKPYPDGSRPPFAGIAGIRTMLAVPLRTDSELIGSS